MTTIANLTATLIALTGCRIDDLTELTWSDIDLEGGQINIAGKTYDIDTQAKHELLHHLYTQSAAAYVLSPRGNKPQSAVLISNLRLIGEEAHQLRRSRFKRNPDQS